MKYCLTVFSEADMLGPISNGRDPRELASLTSNIESVMWLKGRPEVPVPEFKAKMPSFPVISRLNFNNLLLKNDPQKFQVCK